MGDEERDEPERLLDGSEDLRWATCTFNLYIRCYLGLIWYNCIPSTGWHTNFYVIVVSIRVKELQVLLTEEILAQS